MPTAGSKGFQFKPSRTETDSMGSIELPADALYGPQTQRAINNFPVSGQQLPVSFIRALLLAKWAAAKANAELDLIPVNMAQSIAMAVERLLNDAKLMQHFPVDIYQTGSGTSSNMNANEVLASLASKVYGQPISPNDHINFGQSSNDIIPSVIHISAAIELDAELIPALQHLASSIRKKATTLSGHVKTGRTHLMDAMPVTMAQSLNAWASLVEHHIQQLQQIQQELQQLVQGGTAVGTGINTHADFSALFCQTLSTLTSLEFKPAADLFAGISGQSTTVTLSGQLKATATSLMKIANDLRWMNSGPLAGLGEIELEALQPGSSIMPGKVNPVIPEAAAMAAAQVIGNDSAVTIAAQSGNFELNVMLPLVANNLLSSITLLSNSSRLLADKAITSFTVNQTQLEHALARNPILITALNPVIGYEKAAAIAKQAYKEKRPIIDVAEENTELSRQELSQLLDPARLTKGGLS